MKEFQQIGALIKVQITSTIFLRIFIAVFALIAIIIISIQSLNTPFMVSANQFVLEKGVESSFTNTILGVTSVSSGYPVTSQFQNEIIVSEPDIAEIETAKVKYTEKIRRIEEERKRKEEEARREKMRKVGLIQQFLTNQGSPMAPHAELILDTCLPHGVHFCKLWLSVAGVESGFGRVALGKYNAWGIISMRWSSWETSIPQATQWFVNNYYSKGVTTIEGLAYSSYGPQNPEKWITNLYYFYNRIPQL